MKRSEAAPKDDDHPQGLEFKRNRRFKIPAPRFHGDMLRGNDGERDAARSTFLAILEILSS